MRPVTRAWFRYMPLAQEKMLCGVPENSRRSRVSIVS